MEINPTTKEIAESLAAVASRICSNLRTQEASPGSHSTPLPDENHRLPHNAPAMSNFLLESCAKHGFHVQVAGADPGQQGGQVSYLNAVCDSYQNAHQQARTPSKAERKSQIILTSIGFGIDNGGSNWDATEAAVRAVQDATSRSLLYLPVLPEYKVHITLGVPPKPASSNSSLMEPMLVDVSRLTPLLPASIPVLPIQVVVGGIVVAPDCNVNTVHPINTRSIYTAIACVQIHSIPSQEQSSAAREDNGIVNSISAVRGCPQSPPTVRPPTRPQQQSEEVFPTQASAGKEVNRSKSIEMLAKISEEMFEKQMQSTSSLQYASVVQHGFEDNQDDDDDMSPNKNRKIIRYNYKKLPPGKTTKNNRRLFVQHVYRDFSHELPSADVDLQIVNKSPNAAFPVKLHETLSQIEADGMNGIVGWMPHGRAFKIHKQQEFIDEVLPRYFVMTKKSSFLRQLNLYGFNRLSSGPDRGAYYHELFLRGMKFLAQRMVRQKINGNMIRAAGNPDDEPVLSRYPVCPSWNKQGSAFQTIARSTSPSIVPMSAESPTPSEAEGALKSLTAHAKNGNSNSLNLNCNIVSFPLRLQRMLDKLESQDEDDIISWLPHGRAFLVHCPERFTAELMPRYLLRQTKYSSFQRQLHMYNFQRITTGPDKGAYCHPYFLRGKPGLCGKMTRTRVNGKGSRKPANPKDEPDLHQLSPLPKIPPNANIEIPTVTYFGNSVLTDSNGDDFSDSEYDELEDDDSYDEDD